MIGHLCRIITLQHQLTNSCGITAGKCWKLSLATLTRLGKLSHKCTSVGKFEEKLGTHFQDENYALNTKILFTKLGSAILTFKSAI